MVPNRGLVHPWLSEPVWVPENAWPSKTDGNRLRSDEENEETVDRHRDRVSFGHEVVFIIDFSNLFSFGSATNIFKIDGLSFFLFSSLFL